MAAVLVAFASSEGQTAYIADHIAARARRLGHHADAWEVAELPDQATLHAYDGVIVGACVYDGRQQLKRFIRRHLPELSSRPTAFLSLGAPAPGGHGLRAVLEFLDRMGWRPTRVERGEIDTHRERDTTDWTAADGFTDRFLAELG